MKSACYITSRVFGARMDSAEVVSIGRLLGLLGKLGISSQSVHLTWFYRGARLEGLGVGKKYRHMSAR